MALVFVCLIISLSQTPPTATAATLPVSAASALQLQTALLAILTPISKPPSVSVTSLIGLTLTPVPANCVTLPV
ncbi:MAG: hypothetical protein J0651_00360 [Actinobacteria bacterium]|nr:hypothetical protein [Actinomycetota bacterium]